MRREPWPCGRCVRVGEPIRIAWIYAFRRCLSRPPSEPESSTLLDLLFREARRFESPGASPWTFAANDPKKPPLLPPGATPAQLAGWTAVARVLLNLDETITKE